MSMNKEEMYAAARQEFHALDASIKEAEKKIKNYDSDLEEIAQQEAKLRERRQQIASGKRKIAEEGDIVAKAKERSRLAVFLDRKTGTRENH